MRLIQREHLFWKWNNYLLTAGKVQHIRGQNDKKVVSIHTALSLEELLLQEQMSF